ncbi:MAG: Re/Si-specific NAD(P)(+) transhydrogenase subunit alpha [Acidiferrobacterales bacterium]
MKVGIPMEVMAGETRVAATPETVKKLRALGLSVLVQHDAGIAAHFTDDAYSDAGAEIVDNGQALGADIVFKVHKPDPDEIGQMKNGAAVLSMMGLCKKDKILDIMAANGIDAFALEMIPRISRAQGMDVLSSQSSIAGYRAVLEAAGLYGSFFPMMMTSAGSAKPTRVVILGAGVAGLQAIATARRLGAQVAAYDVRPEVKEQIMSLGAKFIEFDLGESGAGTGGYARQLSPEAQSKQQQLLTEELKKADVIISTALIPCRPAPVLITEQAVEGMKQGSVIIDMAAASGGNCPLTEANKTVTKHGVILCGLTNFPALMPSDASAFYSRNLFNFISLLVTMTDGQLLMKDYLEDEITASSLVTYKGTVRFKEKN